MDEAVKFIQYDEQLFFVPSTHDICRSGSGFWTDTRLRLDTVAVFCIAAEFGCAQNHSVKREDIVAFLNDGVEPIPPVPPFGKRYRVATTLRDGTQLPCVVIEGTENTIKLAIKRFEATRQSEDPYMGYEATVKSFVTKGNTINDYDLGQLSLSPFAIPVARAREIRGETSMGWTAFSAVMRDGREFHFGTSFLMEFFDMPEGYTAGDITKIIPAARGEGPKKDIVYYREKPFFTCYVDGV